MASQLNDTEFYEDCIKGKVTDLKVDNEREMLVYACYLVECWTFGNRVDFESTNEALLREKAVYTLVSIINF